MNKAHFRGQAFTRDPQSEVSAREPSIYNNYIVDTTSPFQSLLTVTDPYSMHQVINTSIAKFRSITRSSDDALRTCSTIQVQLSVSWDHQENSHVSEKSNQPVLTDRFCLCGMEIGSSISRVVMSDCRYELAEQDY